MIEYNTKRNKLAIREYGRNVQKMVEDAMKIEDREKRNETARAIVRVMAQLSEVKDPSIANKKNLWTTGTNFGTICSSCRTTNWTWTHPSRSRCRT